MIVAKLIFAAVLSLTSLAAAAAPGWKGRGSGGWGMDGGYGRAFDPKSVTTVDGEILRVERMSPRSGMSRGIHVALMTTEGEISVHLGPEWYLERQDFELNPGDRVRITGSRSNFDGKPALIASELRKGASTLVLRDDEGYPAWSGSRGRR